MARGLRGARWSRALPGPSLAATGAPIGAGDIVGCRATRPNGISRRHGRPRYGDSGAVRLRWSTAHFPRSPAIAIVCALLFGVVSLNKAAGRRRWKRHRCLCRNRSRSRTIARRIRLASGRMRPGRCGRPSKLPDGRCPPRRNAVLLPSPVIRDVEPPAQRVRARAAPVPGAAAGRVKRRVARRRERRERGLCPAGMDRAAKRCADLPYSAIGGAAPHQRDRLAACQVGARIGRGAAASARDAAGLGFGHARCACRGFPDSAAAARRTAAI